MPYKDKTKQLEFQRKWMAERRKTFLASQGPCACGATDGLTLIKKQYNSTADSHVWSLSDKLREKALERYKVACGPCARKEMNDRMREERMGTPGNPQHLNHADVWAIRGRLMGKESMRQIARVYGLQHRTVSDIKRGKVWGWLKRGSRKVYAVDE